MSKPERMTIQLGPRIRPGERITRGACLHNGRRLTGEAVDRSCIAFEAEPRGLFVVEVETDSGRRVWAKLEL